MSWKYLSTLTPEDQGILKENYMKNTYATPTAVVSGNVVHETRSGINSGPEGVKFPLASGRVGFYL